MKIWEWLGAILCIIAQLQRSLNPKWIIMSFVTSSLASFVLAGYLFKTGQYGLLMVELVFIVTNIVGWYKWRKYNGKNIN